MDELLKYWPVFISVVGLIVWLIRLEGLTKQNRETMEKYYATKQSVSEVSGSVIGLSGQIADIKISNSRIESKVDALLVAKARAGG